MRRLLWFSAGFVPRILVPLGGIPGYDTLSALQLSSGWPIFPSYELKIPILDAAVAWAAKMGAPPLIFLTFVIALGNGILLAILSDRLPDGDLKLGLLAGGLFLTTSFSPKFSVGLLVLAALILYEDPLHRTTLLSLSILLHHVTFLLASFVWFLLILDRLKRKIPEWEQPKKVEFLPLVPIVGGGTYYILEGVRLYWAGVLPNFFLLPSLAILLSSAFILLEGRGPRLSPRTVFLISSIPLALAVSWAGDRLPGGALALLPGAPIVLALPLLTTGKCRKGGFLLVPALTLLTYGLLSGPPALSISFNRGIPLLLLALVFCPVRGNKKVAALALAAALLSAPLSGMALKTSNLGRVEYVSEQDLAAVFYACDFGKRVISDDHYFQIALRISNCSAYPGVEYLVAGKGPPNSTIIFSSRMIWFVQVTGTVPAQLPPNWEDAALREMDVVYSSSGDERILVFRT